ncbi:hypothetical protein [Candidatus Accumulibacter contiguus]|jgi:hypothetical protein|uniref:Methyl-accepting chemotaxis protein n=1 Tax=Candidatus Accumulibacter contiguus TaxID=2954381 RepID=A0ABX1TBA9_9PROT|nr:hypothetical protein [Candidatus Accumulibacter contiguus]NMQ06373.1 hypothetical protein [Candidatus Accumulibacter contiguus]
MDSTFSAVRKKSKAIAVAVALLSLVTLNLLTLTNDSVHAKAYGFLESIARATVGVGVLQNSPTEVARRAVAATRELRSQNEHLVSRNQELLSENDRVVLQKKNLAHRTLILVEAVNTLIAHTSALQAEMIKATAWAQWYENRHEEMRRVAHDILGRATARLSRGAVRSASTLSGKAIPVVGAAIAVGASGLDLIDTCKIMKDMNHLAKSMELPEEEGLSSVCRVALPAW